MTMLIRRARTLDCYDGPHDSSREWRQQGRTALILKQNGNDPTTIVLGLDEHCDTHHEERLCHSFRFG